jgi:hypothetical protein
MNLADQFSSSNGHEGNAAGADADVQVVLLYENALLGEKAKSLVHGMQTSLGRSEPLRMDTWQFDSLHATWFGLHARRSVANAQMIIVAANGNRTLPDEVTAGLKRWLQKNGTTEQALVAFLEADHGQAKEPNRAYSQLETLARQSGLDFFAHISRPEISRANAVQVLN